MSIGLILAYIDNKKNSISQETDANTLLAKNTSPYTRVGGDIVKDKAQGIVSAAKNSPLGQLGVDYLSEMIAKSGNALVNNVDNLVQQKIGAPVAQAQQLVYDTIAAALVAKNDLGMFFIQKLAQEIVDNIVKKREMLDELNRKLTLLYNALNQFLNSHPFFDEYLAQLRQALSLIVAAKMDVQITRDTLSASDLWLNNRFKDALKKLEQADKLMTPQGDAPAHPISDSKILTGVGAPSGQQQIQLFLQIPQTLREAMAACSGYIFVVLKINVLLFAFMEANSAFTTTTSKMLKNYSVNTLTNLIAKMELLIKDMALKLNGNETATSGPIEVTLSRGGTGGSQAYYPDPAKISSQTISWAIEIKTLISYMSMVPGPTLSTVQQSNDALAAYNKAVLALQKMDTISEGTVVLTAVDGREDVGQMEKQMITLVLGVPVAMMNKSKGLTLLSLCRTLIRRNELARARDMEIEALMRNFISAPLPLQATLKRVGDGIYSMLDKFGLDRASDMLKKGDFKNFFNLDGKTATFAGAALTGIAFLKGKLTTSEDREQLTQAQREIEKDVKSNELYQGRTANNGFTLRKKELEVQESRLNTLDQRSKSAATKIGLPDDLAFGNLFQKVGPALGVGLLGSTLLQGKHNKLGKGIF